MYQYYIDGVLLPVAPSAMDTNINNNNTTIKLLNGEEINIIKKVGLSDVSFTALLPNKEYPFTIYEGGSFQNAKYYLDLFERLKKSQKPFLFLVIRTDESGNVVYRGGDDEDKEPYYTLEEYTIKENAEEYGTDCGVELSLKQYRSYTTATGSIQIDQNSQTATVTQKRDSTSKQTAKSYTVQKGDTLWNICKKELGDGAKYQEIAQKNSITTPNNIQVGQVIQLETEGQEDGGLQ